MHSAERDDERFGAAIQEPNFRCSVRDGMRLPEEVVTARFDDHAGARTIDVQPVGLGGRTAVEADLEAER